MKESLLQSPVELELQSHDDENLDDPLLQQQQPALHHGDVGGHSGPINWAAFSPDSCRLLTCSDDKTARLLNLRTRNVAIMRGHDAAVTLGEFSAGSAAALTCSRDGSVRLWNAESGSVLHILRPASPAHLAAFSLSGAQLVCCCDDNRARVFSCSSGDEMLVLSGHTARLRSALFSRDGSKILTSSDDGSARLWSVESGEQIKEFKGHSKKLSSASFSPDDLKVLTCSEVSPVHPRTTRIWSCDSGQLLLDADKTKADSVSRHLSRPWGCESVFSPDGLHVVTVSDDRQRIRLSFASSGETALLLGPYSDGLHSFQFSDDGLLLLLCCGGGSCHILCARSGALFLSIRSPVTASLSPSTSLMAQPLVSAHASFSPDCRQIVFLPSGSCIVHLHSLSTSCLQTPYKFDHKHTASSAAVKRKLTSACVDCSGNKILCCTDDRLAVVFSCSDGNEILTLSGHTKTLRSAVFSRDGSKILTSSDDGSARLWSSDTGFELTKIVFEIMDEAARSNVLSQLQSSTVCQNFQERPVAGAALSPDSALIATCSSLDHIVSVWNARTGLRIEWSASTAAAQHSSTVTSIQFCGCSLLITSSSDGSVRLWTALTGQQTKIFDGAPCVSLILQRAASSSFEQPQFLLEMSEPVVKSIFVTSQQEAVFATLSPHASPAAIPFGKEYGGVTHAAFSHSGSYFAASYENGSCTVHSSAAGAPLWQLVGHTGRVNCVEFAGCDRFVITSGSDKLVIFWQLPEIESKAAPTHLQPLLSLPFDVEIVRVAAVCNLLLFASVDTDTSSHPLRICSDGVLHLGGSLSLFFDAGALKYMSCSADQDAVDTGHFNNRLFSRYLLPPVWIIDRILASSHEVAKVQLRALLQGPSAGAVALHERLSRPSILSCLASNGNTESLSFLLRLQAPSIPFLYGPLLFAAVNGTTQHKSDCVALILRHFAFKILNPGEFPFIAVEKDNICAAIIKAFKDSDLLHVLLQFFKHLPMQPSTLVSTTGSEGAVRAPLSEDCPWIARASGRMHPENFWKKEQFVASEGTPLIMASASVTPFAMCGKIFGANQSLLRSACILEGGLSREFFSCLLFQIIVSFKWVAFGRRRCMIRLLRYLVFQILLVLLTSSFGTETSNGNRGLAVFVCVACIPPLAWEIHHIAYHVVASARQFATQNTWRSRLLSIRYFRDFWNLYDVVRVIFTTASLAAVAANSRSNSAWLLSIALYLRWLGLLFFLMPFESTGPLVRMIFQIGYGIRWLLLVLAIAIVAVAHSFWILIGKNPSGEFCSGIDDFDDVGVSLFSAFNMLVLGVFQIDTFTKCGQNQVVSRVLFLFSMVFIPIVLLNLLIAIMSYNFHQVKTHERSELFKLRARIILDIETFMSDEERSDHLLFPNFFQILQKKVSSAESEDDIKSDLYSRLDAHTATVEELCAKTTSALAAKDATIAEMSRMLQLLLERSASSS